MARRWITAAATTLGIAAAVAVWAQAPPALPPRPAGGPPQPPQQQQPPPFDVRQFIAQFDRNRDGFLDLNEVPQELRAVFAQIDTNRDGKLSADELRAYFARNPPPAPPQPTLADEALDVALDAAQDPNELADLQRAYELMRLIDVNGDGKITADEVRAARPRLIERRADSIIREFDTNKDGRISRQEAKGQLLQDFDKIDTNRDGFIDRAEMVRALTAQVNQPPAGPPQPIPPPRRPGAPAPPQRP